MLEIGRIRTPGMFDLSWRKPDPLVPRRWRQEVTERIAADGTVVTPLDEDTVHAAAQLFRREGIESVAICFINSYVNPAHERRVHALLIEIVPEIMLTASCDVLPEIKEYERTSTAVVNAYLLPAMRQYLARLSGPSGGDRHQGSGAGHGVQRRHDRHRRRAGTAGFRRRLRPGGRGYRRRPAWRDHDNAGRHRVRHGRHDGQSLDRGAGTAGAGHRVRIP